MSASGPGDGAHMYSCRCLNIAIKTYKPTSEPPYRPEPHYERAFVGEDGIRITHHFLTLRTRDRAQPSSKTPSKLVQHLALSCLACKTLAYRVAHEISPESEAREGPVIPTEDWVEQETLRSKNGWIEVFIGTGGCLVGKAIEQQLRSIEFSRTFSIGILSSLPSLPPADPSLSPLVSPLPDSSAGPTLPERILPSLPPLFPPPPFTPSHTVFVSLSTHATERSNALRLRAEEDTRNFVQAQLDMLEREEAQLRGEVEGIWRGYREGWKEVLGKANEERRHSVAGHTEGSAPATSAKSGAPVTIRDFSPIIRSHPQNQHSHSLASPPAQPSSPSLLSASLHQPGAHLPAVAARLPESEMSTPGRPGPSSPHIPDTSDSHSPHVNGTRSSGSSSISIKAGSESSMPGAFKRNMDTNVDVASSLAWAKGEEEMRRRLGGGDDEPGERARKRTSKNLGIGAVEKPSNTAVASLKSTSAQPAPEKPSTVKNDSPQTSDRKDVKKLDSDSQADSQKRPSDAEANRASAKAKRRVTFDVQPDKPTAPEAVAKRSTERVDEVELFDLDDPTSTQFSENDSHASQRPHRPRPVSRTLPYKLRATSSTLKQKDFQPGSLPAAPMTSSRSPVNGNTKWPGVSARRSVGLADALPLLSSSVPAGDRILAERSRDGTRTLSQAPRTPSPSAEQIASRLQVRSVSPQEDRASSPVLPPMLNETEEPTEAELKNLLAASAPSHRHAWREGGRAWEIFHQRSRHRKKAKGAIAEEGSEGMFESSDENSEDSSDGGDSMSGEQWRNPSQFAVSLPVQIRPLVEYKASLQPKTSLADKQGVLVPPLQVQSNSATAYRKAVYAERDRTRSIDPGPTLDFSEQEEVEEEDIPDELGDGGRGRRHALSILQARSVIPEEGMWRSMAS